MVATQYMELSRVQTKKDNNLYRIRKEVSQRDIVYSYFNGRKHLSFCSNDYLGLSQDIRVINAFKQGADQYGVGSGASAMISGYTTSHRELEEKMAAFLQRDKAILFNSGYMANIGIMQTFASKNSVIYQDKLNHASLLDAAKFSNATLKRYRHLDMQHLISLMTKCKNSPKLIAAEGVYSMEGDISPIRELAKIAQNSDALLLIDDAHGIGVLGHSGGGSVEHHGLSQIEVPLLVCPLGKAFGGSGAIVAGNKDLIDALLQTARTYIYTTNISPAMASALAMSLVIIQTESWRRHQLNTNIDYFLTAAKERNLSCSYSTTAIQSIIIGSAEHACKVSDKLLAKGILIFPICPPTVPINTSRLRITLTCQHEKEQIDFLLDSLEEVTFDFLSCHR